MKKLKLSCILSLGVLLFGCAEMPNDPPNSARHIAAEDSGVIFGSIGMGRDSLVRLHKLKYRLVGTKDTGNFAYFIGQPAEFKEGEAKGRSFAVRLPPGNYELFNFEFGYHAFGEVTRFAHDDFSIPFSVSRGGTTYLGEFLSYNVLGDKNLLGSRPFIGFYFVVADKSVRDLALLQKNGINIASDSILKSIPDANAVGLPFFRVHALPPPVDN